MRYKGLLLPAALLAFTIAPALAADEVGSAPAMFGVKEVLLQYARMGSSKAAEACGIPREELMGILAKELKDSNVPTTTVTQAKPPIMGEARIELVPEISSINSQGTDCISWLSLSAQSQSTAQILPVKIPRNVVVTYWRSGQLVGSSQTTHKRVLGDAFQKLIRQFAQQYRLDQPPILPALDEPAKD